MLLKKEMQRNNLNKVKDAVSFFNQSNILPNRYPSTNFGIYAQKPNIKISNNFIECIIIKLLLLLL